MKFKTGDSVRFVCEGASDGIPISYSENGIPPEYIRHGSMTLGHEYEREGAVVLGIFGDKVLVEWTDFYGNPMRLGFPEESLILMSINNLTNKEMSILEKFALTFKSEPEKSFRKAGITNGDDLLTDEGQKIFLSWMLKKHGAEFKKDVVDPILEDLKENK